MSARVAYWVSSFEPTMEAVASEVALLRQHFPDSIAWGIDPSGSLRLSRHHGYAFHPRFHLLFRALSGVIQGRFRVNHLFGGLGDWHHLRSLRTRPAVLTVAVEGEPSDRALLDKIDQFAVEWPGARRSLIDLGIEDSRISVVPPPVDLTRFVPTGAPDGPFTVLFASAPARADWLTARGIDVILEAAQLRPDMRFRLLWRPWGDSYEEVVRRCQARQLDNVEICLERVQDMARVYTEVFATVFPAVEPEHCKPVPNSIIESLASGRPVVVSKGLGITEFIGDHPGARVIDCEGEALAHALDGLQGRWSEEGAAARRLAETVFAEPAFIERYRRIYADLAPG